MDVEDLFEKRIDIEEIKDLVNQQGYSISVKFKGDTLQVYLKNSETGKTEYATSIPLKELGSVSIKVFLESLVDVREE